MQLMKMGLIAAFLVSAGNLHAEGVQGEREIRKECSGYSQAEMRVCLDNKAAASAAELSKAEQRVREALAKWDEDPKYIQLASARLEAAIKQFTRYRDDQCAFNASLSGGGAGNSTELRRLACVTELNLRRADQLKATTLELPAKQ
jgi:hypothetical protein